jgi:deazaflavin-dependent oxidoreductase (nitroreductase family)
MERLQEGSVAVTWRRVWWRRAIQRLLTSLHITCYRATGGVIGHRVGSLPNLLLTSTGRRSGKPRISILTYICVDEQLAVIASNFGSRTTPQWYRNLEQRPEALAQLKSRRWPVRARLATPDERARIWSAALALWPAWASYAMRAQREIPIIVLDPAE